MILVRDDSELARKVDEAVYPYTQGGPLMHVIAAKAVAFHEAMQADFVAYQRLVLSNAKALAEELASRDYEIVTGGTDNHMLLVDLGDGVSDARHAEAVLERAHIAVSSIRLPRPDNSVRFSGLRLGTPAVTTRGLGDAEIRRVAQLVADVLDDGDNVVTDARAEVLAICERFPVYAHTA